MTEQEPDSVGAEAPPATEARQRGILRLLKRSGSKGLPDQGSLRWSFTWAFEGIVYVMRTQRNMRLHVASAFLAVVAGLVLNVTRLELLVVLAAITFVIVSEMFNTALEAAIDAVITEFHPLVKIAKDVAAGAVLIATVNAAAVAYLVFYENIAERRNGAIEGVRDTPTLLVLAALILTVLAAIAIKAATGRGTPLRGGLPSGHAAAAFAAWAAITIVAEPLRHSALISMLAFLMALLVAQSRVEAGIHSGIEVVAGGLLGTLVTVLVFQLAG
jgi:diacylglycerol kinase (ATP)